MILTSIVLSRRNLLQTSANSRTAALLSQSRWMTFLMSCCTNSKVHVTYQGSSVLLSSQNRRGVRIRRNLSCCLLMISFITRKPPTTHWFYAMAGRQSGRLLDGWWQKIVHLNLVGCPCCKGGGLTRPIIAGDVPGTPEHANGAPTPLLS